MNLFADCFQLKNLGYPYFYTWILATASDVTRILYFKYATETEMACVVGKPLNDNNYTVFKTSMW